MATSNKIIIGGPGYDSMAKVVAEFLRSKKGEAIIKDMLVDAPNYRPAEYRINCANCGHGRAFNFCRLYDFNFNPDWLCDAWAPVRSRREFNKMNQVKIAKIDEEQQLVFGFFNINKIGDGLVEDLQGDLIETSELEKAAYNFVLDARVAGENHIRKGVGRLVESIVLTYEKQSAIAKCLESQGIDVAFSLGCEGWFGGFKVDDPDVWQAVKDGDYPAFSIGGSGRRVPVE
jgi:hypothetical protein